GNAVYSGMVAAGFELAGELSILCAGVGMAARDRRAPASFAQLRRPGADGAWSALAAVEFSCGAPHGIVYRGGAAVDLAGADDAAHVGGAGRARSAGRAASGAWQRGRALLYRAGGPCLVR